MSIEDSRHTSPMNRPHPSSSAPTPIDDTVEHKLAIWQSLAERRSAYDSLLWQTPALSMTAQAFLFTLTLAPDVSRLGRTVAAALSIAIAVVSTQLMSKHRRHEISDCLILERLEESLSMKEITGVNPHAAGVHRRPTDTPYPDSWTYSFLFHRFSPTQLSSFGLWIIGQALFAVADIVIIVLVATGNGSAFN